MSAAEVEPTETCDSCGECIDEDARCDHGRLLCAACLHRCPGCRYDDERWG